MKRSFLLVALILALLTTACAAGEGTTPTLIGTTLPDVIATSTPLLDPGITDTVQPTVVFDSLATNTAFPTMALETSTPTAGTTGNVSTPQATAIVIVSSPVAQGVQITRTAVIPVTGLDITLVECQFCVDNIAHALLVLPDTATFEIVSSTTEVATVPANSIDTSCATIEVNNGRQVVLCRGPELTPINLNICTGNACSNFPLDLLACPLAQSSGTDPNATPTP